MALHHPKRVVFEVLARHKPRLVLTRAAQALRLQRLESRPAGLYAADAQALALAQRVKAQAHMLADHAAVVALDRPRCFGNVAIEKFAERPLANEADAGRVFLAGIGQANLIGNASHLAFVQLTHRKQRV